MKKSIIALALFAVVGGFSGCAGSGAIKWDNARQVKAGMTQQEVVGLMGQPYSVASTADGSVKLIWVHVGALGGSETAVMTFKDGKAIDSFRVPDSF